MINFKLNKNVKLKNSNNQYSNNNKNFKIIIMSQILLLNFQIMNHNNDFLYNYFF